MELVTRSDEQVQHQHQHLEEVRGSPYLRFFEPRAFSAYENRYYTPKEYLNQIGIERVAELVQHGKCLDDIACILDISSRVLIRWINATPANKSVLEEAREFAGETFAYKAEKVLLEAPLISEALTKARALAEHYRWKAERLHKEQYGTKTVKHEGNIGGGVVFNMNIALEKTQPVIDAIVDNLPEDVEYKEINNGG